MGVVARRRGGIRHLHREPLRVEKAGEPVAHPPGAADHQSAAATAPAACLDPASLLGRERGADQELHHLFRHIGRDPFFLGDASRALQHLPLLGEVAKRAGFTVLHLSDGTRDFLAAGYLPQDLPVDLRQLGA
jgi:hypothetical protein